MKPWLLAAAAAGILAGCGQPSAESLGAANAKLFQSSDPPIKSQWDAATAAVKTNGFAEAILALTKMQSATLSPEQRKAVDETVTAVSDQMYESANKGEAAGLKAIEKMRQATGR